MSGNKEKKNGFVTRIKSFGLPGVAAAVLLGGGGAAVYTPDTSGMREEVASNSYEIFPGWIERNGEQQPFIQLDKGHFRFMRAKIYGNPLLFDLTKDYFTYLEELRVKGERIKLGDALRFNIIRAEERMSQIDSSLIDPQTNIELETGRAAVYSFTAGFTAKWWTAEDLVRFDVPLDQFRNDYDYYWGRRGIGHVYPGLFGAGEEQIMGEVVDKDKNGGQDRTVHFAQHLFIAFEELYSRENNLSVHESKPGALRLMLLIRSFFSKNNVQSQSFIIGRAYEFTSLGEIKNWPVLGRIPNAIVEGPFDEKVEADYKGNKFGAITAEALFYRWIIGQSINEIIFRLNDPIYEFSETEPDLSLLR